MNRRTFLAAAATVLAARARTRGMLLHLSPGAIGVKGSPQQILDWASKFGFDAIDADSASVAALSPAEMKAKNVGWAIAGLPVEFRKDDAAFRAGMADLPAQVKKLKAAGVERMTTWISPSHRELTYRDNFRQHAARMREVARVTNDHGLRFGMEYVAPKTLWAANRFPFIHTMREMRELVSEINQPNVGIVLDSWHWYTSHDTREEIAALRGRDIVSVDLNDAPAGIPIDEQVDSRRELPAATGVIDVRTFLGALESIGYDGPVRAEPFNEAVRRMPPEEALAATMAALKKAFAA